MVQRAVCIEEACSKPPFKQNRSNVDSKLIILN